MNERNKKTLSKMLLYIYKIRNYMKDVHTFNELDTNALKKDAIVFNLMQIGELSNKKLTDDFKNKHDSIP